MSIERLPEAAVEREWLENGMPEKRAAGLLIEIIVFEAPARDPRYAGGVHRVRKILTPNGRHIGTWHEVETPDGSVPHGHVKEHTRRDCTRIGPPDW